MALVHEFRTKSRIFISTEAGAKGLNLQFCESLINYDLPWNPQRIEQRIGRVHRYGQKRSVFVFNLIDLGNEAASLTYDILTRKLDLFGKVLDASDDVLHTPDHDFPLSLVSDVGVDFERQVRQVYQQATSIEDVMAKLRGIREAVDQNRKEFDQTQHRCAELIDTRLDETVAQVFRNYQSQLPTCLAELDHEMDAILYRYLDVIDCVYSRNEDDAVVVYEIGVNSKLPSGWYDGGMLQIGDGKKKHNVECLYQGHPLLEAAIAEAKSVDCNDTSLKLHCEASSPLAGYVGKRGRVNVTKLEYRGLVALDRLLVTMVFEGSQNPVESLQVADLLSLRSEEMNVFLSTVDNELMEECVGESIFDDQHHISKSEQQEFDSRSEQLDRYLQDRIIVIEQKRLMVSRTLSDLDRRRETSSSPAALDKIITSARSASREIARLGQQLDELRNGDEPNYRAWREKLLVRRSMQPQRSMIVDTHFELLEEKQRC